MTSAEARQLIGLIAAVYPTPSWEAETLRAYAQLIGDLDAEPAKRAVETWVRSKRERPTVADIRNATAQELAAARAIPGELEPDEAWGLVMRAASTVGRYQPFPATHQVVAEIVERMGWEQMCLSDNLEATRAHFLQLYRVALERARTERTRAPAVALPTDQERLEKQRLGTTGPSAERQALPSPADRSHGLTSVRDLIAAMEIGARPVPRQELPAEATELREPTRAEVEEAQRRRASLRQQLVVLDGGRAA